jgi:hypothetical protein
MVTSGHFQILEEAEGGGYYGILMPDVVETGYFGTLGETEGGGITLTETLSVPAGTLTVGIDAAKLGPTTLDALKAALGVTAAKQGQWDAAYTDRLKWDGAATGLVAATGRASLELGTLAQQAADAVSITGGTIAGLTSLGATAATLGALTHSTGQIAAATDANLTLTAPGAGNVVINSGALRPATDAGSALGSASRRWAALYADNLLLDGNTLSSLDTNGPIFINPNNTGGVAIGGTAAPHKLCVRGNAALTSSSAKTTAQYFYRHDIAEQTNPMAAIGMFSAGASNHEGVITFLTKPGAYNAALVEQMRLHYNGFLGVGDNAPTERVTVTGNVKASGSLIAATAKLTALPTSNPAVAGALWNDAGTVKISAG